MRRRRTPRRHRPALGPSAAQPFPAPRRPTPTPAPLGPRRGAAAQTLGRWQRARSSVTFSRVRLHVSEVCAPSVCAAAPLPCGSTASWMCTNGSSVSSCSAKKAFWPGTGSCRACCDVTSCGVAPPSGGGGGGTSAPRPANPWDAVPNATHCTLNGPPLMTPDGRATPYGGQDVTLHGCTPWVSDSCCGVPN